MNEYKPTNQERIAIERDIQQLDATALAEKSLECYHCGRLLTEGHEITVQACKTPNEACFELSYVKCFEHEHKPYEEFSDGVRELVVEGRIGRCSDHTRQTSWPVLLHPQARIFSPATTADGYLLPGEPGFRIAIATSEPIDAYREICWRTDHPPRSVAEQQSGMSIPIDGGGN